MLRLLTPQVLRAPQRLVEMRRLLTPQVLRAPQRLVGMRRLLTPQRYTLRREECSKQQTIFFIASKNDGFCGAPQRKNERLRAKYFYIGKSEFYAL